MGIADFLIFDGRMAAQPCVFGLGKIAHQLPRAICSNRAYKGQPPPCHDRIDRVVGGG